MIVTIQDYIKQMGPKPIAEIAKELGVSMPMVSQYKKGFNASLEVAKRVYKEKGIVLHPFSKESLQYEIKKEK
jgi:predicted transcriptional regulator